MGKTHATRQSDFYPRPPRGGRHLNLGRTKDGQDISIHALREEGDIRRMRRRAHEADFYPRPPRGGRREQTQHEKRPSNFYPRPPRGGRHPGYHGPDIYKPFLSTPSARRATNAACRPVSTRTNFYPRPPRGGRHDKVAKAFSGLFISIHALREEGDVVCEDFCAVTQRFLSTPSARRATKSYLPSPESSAISIHALREEGDSKNRDKISIFL